MSAHQPWMGPVTPIAQALISREARARRDRELCAWCGLSGTDAEDFLARVEQFDRTTRSLEVLAVDAAVAEVEETLAGLRRRADALVADLVDQLHGEVVP